MSETTRRAVLAGAAGVTAMAALAACGDDAPEDTGGDSGGNPGGANAGAALAGAAEIPVGGGKIFAAQKVVVTQPTAGNFKAFSATCTHQQCTVATVEGGKINCPCHGSAFKIEDGSVVNGPATRPLPARTLKVEGDKLVLG